MGQSRRRKTKLSENHNRKTLRVEQLENRMLLAGDLCAPFDGPSQPIEGYSLEQESALYGPQLPTDWTAQSSFEGTSIDSTPEPDTGSQVLFDFEEWGAGFQPSPFEEPSSADVPHSFQFEKSGYGRLDGAEESIPGTSFEQDWTGDYGFDNFASNGVAPNLSVNSISIRDANGSLVSSIPIGQRVAIQVNFATEGIPFGSSFDIAFTYDGITLLAQNITWAVGTGNWFAWWSGWYAGPGSHNFSAELDSGQTVFETDESDNLGTGSFTPFAPTDVPKLLFPSGGVRNQDFAVNNYADVDPRSNLREDFAGGIFQYDGHNAWDFGPANFLYQDKGLPILAAADGVVTDAVDGNFDRKTSFANTPANYVIIDHGNNWNTIYWHLARDSVAVEVGQTVKAGDVLGDMGSSGISTGTHLHYTLRRFNFPVETMYDTNTYYHPDADVAYQPTTKIGGIDGNISNDSSPSTSDWRESFPTRRVFGTSDAGERVVFNFRLSHMNIGDTYQIRYLRPDRSVGWNSSLTASQQYRFPGWYWWIGSSVWASQIGMWEAQILVDNEVVVSEEFEVVSGAAAAQIRVYDPSNLNVNPGRTTPFDFGSVAGSTRTFRIENHGDSNLVLGAPQMPMGFSQTGFPSAVTPGGTATFQVTYDGGLNSTAFGAIRFATNDPDLPEFWFNLEGLHSGSIPFSVAKLNLNGSALAYQLGTAPKPLEDDADFVPGSTPATVQSLTLQWEGGAKTGDQLSIADRDGIVVNNDSITLNGSAIGTITQDGIAPNPLVVNITPSALPQATVVEALIGSVDFYSSSDITGPRFLRAYTMDTGGVLSTQAYKSVRAHEAIYDLAKLTNISYGDDPAQRSRIETVDIEFDSEVIVDPGAFQVNKLGPGGGAVNFVLSTSNGVSGTIVTLDFQGTFTEHNSLSDGRYELLIDGNLILGSHGQAADLDDDGLRGGQFTNAFHRFFADMNGDGIIGFTDFAAFRNTFSKSAGQTGFVKDFDFDDDDVIGFADFTELRKRFGQSLP